MKQLIRLTEGDLHQIIENAVRRTINEISKDTVDNFHKGRIKQSLGKRPYSDAFKRRADRDYKYVVPDNNPNISPLDAANRDSINRTLDNYRKMHP